MIRRRAWITSLEWNNALEALTFRAERKPPIGPAEPITVGDLVEASNEAGFWATVRIEGAREEVRLRIEEQEWLAWMKEIREKGSPPEVAVNMTVEIASGP